MTIEKLKNGKYRIVQMQNGQRYRITLDHKPSVAEATILIAKELKAKKVGIKGSFAQMCYEYIESKSNVLSPRTIREYKLYVNRLPDWFTDCDAGDIDQVEIQNCVNELSERLAPKTVTSLHGFISAVVAYYNPDLRLHTTLPQRVKTEPYIPTAQEVKRIVEYTKEHSPMFYVPIRLATLGLRRSEICALTLADLSEENILSINKALVEDENGEWIIKHPKTVESTRTIPIDEELADYIRKHGMYSGSPQSISNYLLRTQKQLGIKEFSVHKLRHYFASKLLSDGVPIKDIMLLGGWSTDDTLKKIYAHAMRAKTIEGKRSILSSLF